MCSFFFHLIEMPSPDEMDVYRNLQVCLKMRRSYVFREAVAPWEKEIISDPSTPKPNPNPFNFIPEGKSDVRFYISEITVCFFCCFYLFSFSGRTLWGLLDCQYLYVPDVKFSCSITFKWKMVLFKSMQIKRVRFLLSLLFLCSL